MSLETLLLSLHVVANLFWIGSIVSVGVLLAAPGATPKDRGALARLLYMRLAVPAFGVSFVAGLGRLLLNAHFYLVVTHFMHAKLLLALGVIAIHHVLGAKARRAAAGEANAVNGAARLAAILAVLAVGAAWLVLTKPF